MWLRHFRHKRSKKFQDFKARYHEFREEDITPLCKDHHLELHQIYAPIINAFVLKKSFKPCKDWTWTEAEELMECLRAVCNAWLLDAGSDPRWDKVQQFSRLVPKPTK